jgi:uncharacterized membrane protein required for colicin V production
MIHVLVIAIIGVIAYIWASRGFFSAFLHMLCVIVAGSIAFAVWEPISYLIMGMDDSGSGWLTDMAWSLGLIVPFCIILAIIRLTLDKVVPFNVDLDGVTNLVGGGACGAVSGVLTAGILEIGASYLRIGTELVGYNAMQFESNGSVVRRNAIIPPADRIAAAVFSKLSNTTFRPMSGESLARWRPDLADGGHMMRVTFPSPDGGGRQSVKPEAVEVLNHYTYAPKEPKDLTRDSFDPERTQSYMYVDGSAMNAGQTTIEGYVVRFKAKAKERNGRIVVGNSQVRLIAHALDGSSSMSIAPLAVISQAAGDKPAMGRWRFDSQSVFIASVGGQDDAPMVFEFPVPKTHRPIGIEVKGIRTDVRTMNPFATFDSMTARDNAIRSRAIAPTTKVSDLDNSRAVTYAADPNNQESFIRVTDTIFMGVMIQKDDVGGLEILTEGQNNFINGGSHKFLNSVLSRNIGVDRKLQVRRFAATEDTQIVQVTFDGSNDLFGRLSSAAADVDSKQAPILLDQNGTPYSPVGYMYRDLSETWFHFMPQAPIGSVDDLPSLSRSSPERRLVLIYRVSKNVKVERFVIGNRVLANFKPPVETQAR